MSDGAGVTYEVSAAGIARLRTHASLAASSASLPDGAFTTFRTYDGRRVLRLDRHFTRLDESAALEGRPGSVDRTAARAGVTAALDDMRFEESRLRLTFAPPRLFLAIEPFQPLPARAYRDGVACVTLDLRRDNPHAKDTRFIAAAGAAYSRLPEGVEEGLLVDRGDILEGLSSNFFAILEGTLRTEAERVLLGVTRSIALEVAERIAPVERRAVPSRELPSLREAFITSVSREVLPVVRIDGRPVGDGRVGEITQRIMDAFAALAAREAERL